MANTFCSLNIHCIFSTKERAPMLNPELRERLWPFLGGIAKQNGITPRCIGGVADHVHLLLSLPTTVPIAKAIQLVKAGSSAWIHQTFRQLDNFSWQQGDGAFSVSVSQLPELFITSKIRGRTSSDPNFSTGIPGVSAAA